MKPNLLLGLVLFVFNTPMVLRADYSVFESVEWLTSYADQIGVYRAEKVYGPDVNTNTPQTEIMASVEASLKLPRASPDPIQEVTPTAMI